MSFEKCPKCKQYDYLERHTCYPFHVYYPEYYGEEWKLVYGKYPEQIVEQMAEEINSDEPEFESNIFESPVSVRDKDGTISSFNCTASVSIDYYTKDCDTPEDLPEFKE